MPPEIDIELLQYARRAVLMRQHEHTTLDRPVYFYGNVTTIVLHREGQFQTELVIAHPNSPEWPGEHRHPNVDSIEIEVFNCKGLTRNGRPVLKPDLVFEGRYFVHLSPNDFHGSKATKEGIALLSCQKWLNGVKPTSVGMDWDGAPVHSQHGALIGETV